MAREEGRTGPNQIAPKISRTRLDPAIDGEEKPVEGIEERMNAIPEEFERVAQVLLSWVKATGRVRPSEAHHDIPDDVHGEVNEEEEDCGSGNLDVEDIPTPQIQFHGDAVHRSTCEVPALL